ncbi:MAG: PKD domain-containing protein [Chloroflexi bacterium]|nr:PKD domain-containing protein [Chloroflexota bacterium]
MNYDWDFGDGSSSTDENPTHQYAAAGTYTVTLTVTNPAGNDTYTGTVEILIHTISLPILLKP